MGGAVCIAIRKDDTEHIFDAWTNQFSYFLHCPDFRDGGKMYREYVSRGKPDNEWPKTKTIDAIQSIEYGLVLIDLNYQHVLSRQHYTDPSRMLIGFGDTESVDLAKRLLKAGHISHFHDGGDFKHGDIGEDIPAANYPPTIDSLLTLTSAKRWRMLEAVVAPLVLMVDHWHEGPKDKRDMEWIERWARVRGWKSPFKYELDDDLRMAGDPPLRLKKKRKAKARK